jgi:hypothetical protein
MGRGKTLLARVTGLEPATSGVTGRRSNQLSYTRSVEPAFRGVGRERQPSKRRFRISLPDEILKIWTRKNRDQPIRPIPVSVLLARLVGGDGFEPPALSV